MPTRLIFPPSSLAVTLEQAKANLSIDGSDLDSRVLMYLNGVIDKAEQLTGLSFINQTWRVTLDSFPDAIVLPPPVSSVVSVKYLDSDGVEQTLDPADYLVDSVSQPGYVVPAYGKAWPETYDQVNAVNVEVISGFGADSTDVPDGIRLYIAAKLVEQFDPAIRVEKDTVQSSFIDRLLDPFRTYC